MDTLAYARSHIDEERRLAAIQQYWDDYYDRYEKLALDRFWDFVDGPDANGCLNWTGTLADGYGTFKYRRKMVKAHRWIFERQVGPIPDGHQLDHLCRNRACVNFNHLEPVTQRTNILRGEGLAAQEAVRTHCAHGHEFTPENTYIRRYPDGRFRSRVCRTCKRRGNRERKRRLRAERS